jgi:peptidase E
LSFIANSLNIDNADLLELDQSNLNELKLKEILGVGNKKQIFVYVDGGNTFYLQKFILQSNLFNHLECEDTEYIYLGCSAGAIVAGKSIETAFWKGYASSSLPCSYQYHHL